MDQLADLLRELIDEVRGLRSDVADLRQMSRTIYMDTITSIEGLPREIGDLVTGSVGGIGGKTLDDVTFAVQAVESAVDLK